MADRLAHRNMTGNEAPEPARRNSEYDSDRSVSATSSHDEGEDGTLLVRSTISRDTTQNTPAVDSVDLSKLVAHTNDLLFNARNIGPPRSPRALSPGPDPRLEIPTMPQSHPLPPPPPGIGAKSPITIPSYSLDNPHPNPYVSPSSILAEIKPGSDLTTMYRNAGSDPTRFVSYIWRDTLRITGRRKSESDLGHYREEGNDSWIPVSQHFVPTASRRDIVSSWKTVGLNTKQNNSGSLSLKDSNNQPNLGATLGQAAEAHLGLDLYHGNTQQSMFVGYLLDTIEAIRAERNFLRDMLTRPRPIRQAPTAAPEAKPILLAPKLKVLHRVFCKSPMHGHDQTVFEDLPVRLFRERSQDYELSGKTIIRNLTHYCSENPEISFVVFKEHLCIEDPQAQLPWRAHQRRIQRGSEISPRAERLHVVSDLLQKALDHVAVCSEPESRIGSTGAHEMAAPYLFLYHHRAQLSQYGEQATGVIKQNIMVLLDFLESDYSAEYREADAEFSKGILSQKHLEKLYRPNEIVIEKSEGRDMAYVVGDWPETVDKQMQVPCWTWQYDGVSLQRQYTTLTINLPLPENFTIDKLSFCPIYTASDITINELRKRGRKFWEMKDQYFGCFSSLGDRREAETHHHIRVVVDMFTYSRMHSSKLGGIFLDNKISRFDQWPREIPRDKTPDDSMIMLCPPTVFGFMLQEKTWLKLDVTGIHPIEWNKRAFDRLVLNPKTKELITALVEVRIATGRMEDIIGGKGNGLMILLHGGPGTGKTLTAESVAEIAEKPLYRVTCGDIGTKADDVEKYLQTVLYLGKIWNCVLLLDEADIFLEERTIADLERNSLVSVFLRILEYYDGILIMTSNRVGTFDEAFKSRIQVSLHYEDLSKKSRKTIWSNFIAMLEEGEDDVNINDLESHLDEIASEEMNGRQIRNAMTTARQLALHRRERLQWEHLDQVLKTAREFNQYLKNVQGHTDKQWAREQRLR